MALFVIRSAIARVGGVNSLLGKTVHPSAAVAPIQVATLKATYGGSYPYEKPYPYKTKSFTVVHEFFDLTKPRLNENSKIIVVDGNIGVGKNEFARRLAKSFDLQFIPSVPDSAAFIRPDNGFDMRTLNEVLPETSHFYDLKKFLTDPHPERGTVGRLQLMWYKEKYEAYSKALQHLFHTGQGAVIVRSPFSDQVFVEALKQGGYVSRNFPRYYYDVRDNSICELLTPHLSIYLDAPLETIMERIKKRADPLEMNSKIIDEKFVSAVESAYQNKFLPRMRDSGEVLEIDWTQIADDIDMDAIVEEIQTMDFEAHDREETKFQDWYDLTEDYCSWYRRKYGKQRLLSEVFHRDLPTDCDEILLPRDDVLEYDRLVEEHPALKYEPGWAPELGHKTLFKFQ